jgi:thioredoxin 1
MHWSIYALIGFSAVLLLMQFLTFYRARRSIGTAAPDTKDLDGAAPGERRRLYYFHAAHCGPCRAMTALVDRLRPAHANLIKVDIADRPELARGFGIAGTPSFVLVEDGVIRQVKLGAQSERQLLKLLLEDRP